MHKRTPRALSSPRIRVVRSSSRMVTLSVSSSLNLSGARPESRRIPPTWLTRSFCANCLAEMFTAIVNGGEHGNCWFQAQTWRQACCKIQFPIHKIKPVSSAAEMNPPRHHQPKLRPLPAHQGLEADDVAFAQGNDRLVVNAKFLSFRRAAKICFQPQAARGGGVHRRIAHFIPPLSEDLSPGHCGIGIAQHVFRCAVTATAKCNADARCGKHTLSIDIEGRLDVVLNSFGHPDALTG